MQDAEGLFRSAAVALGRFADVKLADVDIGFGS